MAGKWVITDAGRTFLIEEEKQYITREAFGSFIGCGHNQIRKIHKEPNHVFSDKSINQLTAFFTTKSDNSEIAVCKFKSGVHYESVEKAEGREINLIRDQTPALNIPRGELESLGELYQAIWENPKYQGRFYAFDTVDVFSQWLQDWGNASDDPNSEQFLVYRLYQEKVIAFIYGELHKKSPNVQLYLFAIWYVIGTENATYPGSKTGLPPSVAKALPAGERETIKGLMIRLLEELRDIPTLDYIFTEIGRTELGPGNHSRKLLRIYAKVEIEILRYFENDNRLKNRRFYVLDLPFWTPHVVEEAGIKEVKMFPELFLCCPMRPETARAFSNGKVALSTIITLIKAAYGMYWEYFDADDPIREVIHQKTDAALADFQKQATALGDWINYYTLPDYIKKFFREGEVSAFAQVTQTAF